MEGSILEAFLKDSFKDSNFIMLPPYGSYPEKAPDEEDRRPDDSGDEQIETIALSDFPKDPLKENGMYFIDGAENRYFMGYVEYENYVYPVYVGDVAVCCCELVNGQFSSYHDYHSLIIPLPATLFKNPNEALVGDLDQPGIGMIRIGLLPYHYTKDKDSVKDSVVKDKIHQHMRRCEALVLEQLCEHNEEKKAKVFIDGHFPWNEMTNSSESISSKWKEKPGVQSVISIDKRFSFQDCSPETRKGLIDLQNSKKPFNYVIRESATVEKDETDIKEAIWYFKLRDDPTAEGITSDIIECACVFKGDEDRKKEAIKTWNNDLLSLACPTCYGIEDRNRWRTHIYPIFLTELRCKSIKLSPSTIKHLMYGTAEK